jgi:hypothetical protein
MKTIAQAYGHLWPGSLEKLAGLFKDVYVLHLPSEQEAIEKAPADIRARTIIISEKSTLLSLLQVLEVGYSQVVQKNRADFARELLISAILIQRPQTFFDDAMGVLLATANGGQIKESGKEFSMLFTSSGEKNQIIHDFGEFLRSENPLMALKDLAIQVSEELLMNAQFSAPVDPVTLKKMYQNADRSLNVRYPAGKQGKFYSCYSQERLVIACIDPFGTLSKQGTVEHMRKLFSGSVSEVRSSGTGGAGIGLKYILENSGVFYTFIKKNTYTCVACAFYLKGMKHNMSPEKHIHVIEST